MPYRITVLPGDGIGPEVTREALRLLGSIGDLCGYDFRFTEKPIGAIAVRQTGSPLPEETREAALDADAVLLGAVGSPELDRAPAHLRPEAGLLALWQALGGFANLRPIVAHEALAGCTPLRPEAVRGTNLLIVRELLGGLYFSEPRGHEPGVSAFNTMRYTAPEIERVARVAFQAARGRRSRVASVDKANVLETSRLWREVVSRVARDYPDVTFEHYYVDSFALLLITNPLRFDVVVTENLFGDILSDEAAVLSGSLGMLASATVGGSVDLFEPVHGSAPDIAGTGTANPLGAIATAALLLRHALRLENEAADIERAIEIVLAEGWRTPDLLRGAGPGVRRVSTTEMGTLVERALSDVMNMRHAYHAV
ncbi:MAG TPA: 3-isopropylmalate dehydrogenase [Candidatus Acidoferrales bacterium]|nr:3-isopropylmalate dehydrogenase [Candidatus Acidoferrales bacterium]